MEVKEAVEELKSTKIFVHLIAQSSEYSQRAIQFVQAIAPLLATTQRHFPLYTRHDAHHGYQVVRRLEEVLQEECLKPGSDKSLGASELFLLVAAAYAHDLGMTVFPGEEVELSEQLTLPKVGWETSIELTEYLRREHSKRGGLYIRNHFAEMGVPENLVSALDMVMRSHNLTILELETQLRVPFAAEDRVLDVRQLAAILCIADAIEFSDTRVLDGVVELARRTDGPAAAISYRENRKHDCIRDSLAVDRDGQVFVSGTFDDGEILAAAHRTFDDMESWIRGYCDIDRQSKIPRLKIRAEPFVRRLDFPGGKFERLGVRMSKRAVIDLVASNAVWRGSTGAAIRELLQNAVEACRYRLHHSSPADGYVPQVKVEFDRAAHKVTVSDNGCGMSLRTVLNHFLSVASSRAKEPAYATDAYAPIARFGTGFWSVFTIATKAEIRSLAFEAGTAVGTGLQFEVSLEALKDYTVFREYSMAPGTAVTLHLKPKLSVDDLFEQCRRELVAAAVPIEMIFDGAVSQVSQDVLDVTETRLLGPKTSLMEADGLRVFQWRGDRADIDVAMGLVYRVDGKSVTFRLNRNASVSHRLDQPSMVVPTGVCGFLATWREPKLCLALSRVGTAVINVRSPRGIEYSLDRGQVLESAQSNQIRRGIAQCLHDGYRAFLRQHHAYDPASIYRLNEESELGGGNVFDVYTENEIASAAEDYPDLLCFRLIEVGTTDKLQDATIHHVDLTGLLQLPGICVFAQTTLELPAQVGQYRGVPADNLLPYAYAAAAQIRYREKLDMPVYVLEANRRASLLFDADPTSTIFEARLPTDGAGNHVHMILQRCSLGNMNLDPAKHGIIAVVQGRWTGALYARDFEIHGDQPYAFLGRHRVIIKTHTKLYEQCIRLNEQQRLSKLAELIADLQHHSQGLRPESLRTLV